MRSLIIVLSLLGLAGCETMQQQPNPAAGLVEARYRLWAECDKKISLQVKAALAGKMPVLSSDESTIRMLSNKEIPDEAEKVAILELVELQDRCRADLADLHDRYGLSPISALLRASYPAIRSTYAQLHNGSLSYGQAISRLDEIKAKVIEGAEAYGQAQNAHQAQVAEQRRLAAIQMLQQWNLSNRPSTTNCVRIGAQVSCTTR